LSHLILVKGNDCPLCDEAKSLLKTLTEDLVKFEEKDIFSTRELHTKYWDKIPVLLKNDQELLWPFDANDIQKFNSLY
jgi:glutaredoxin|tara:strand:+ start:497 stop:730 length:234 start_codon:yes stop_codon:yes gene_type:complete